MFAFYLNCHFAFALIFRWIGDFVPSILIVIYSHFRRAFSSLFVPELYGYTVMFIVTLLSLCVSSGQNKLCFNSDISFLDAFAFSDRLTSLSLLQYFQCSNLFGVDSLQHLLAQKPPKTTIGKSFGSRSVGLVAPSKIISDDFFTWTTSTSERGASNARFCRTQLETMKTMRRRPPLFLVSSQEGKKKNRLVIHVKIFASHLVTTVQQVIDFEKLKVAWLLFFSWQVRN